MSYFVLIDGQKIHDRSMPCFHLVKVDRAVITARQLMAVDKRFIESLFYADNLVGYLVDWNLSFVTKIESDTLEKYYLYKQEN